MKIKELRTRPDINENKRLANLYNQLGELLTQLREKELSDELMTLLNNEIEKINKLLDSEEKLQQQLRNSQAFILQIIKKKLKLVTKNHYRIMWTSIGLVGFGLPLLLFSIVLINMGVLKDFVFLRVSLGDIVLSGIPLSIKDFVFLRISLGDIMLSGIPLSIGLTAGGAIGYIKDKKAFKEGRQLDFEMKH